MIYGIAIFVYLLIFLSGFCFGKSHNDTDNQKLIKAYKDLTNSDKKLNDSLKRYITSLEDIIGLLKDTVTAQTETIDLKNEQIALLKILLGGKVD